MEEVSENMAIVKDAATIELIWNLIRGKTDGISKVTFFRKTDFRKLPLPAAADVRLRSPRE